MSTRRPRRKSGGVSLIELVVFIVIVGVAMAGTFAAFNRMTASSADPQVRKQMLAVAESLMEEIQLMPFTYCDPDDANAPTATSSALCTGGTNGANDENKDPLGPEGSEDRYGTTTQFDNVSDYHGFSMSGGIKDLNNNTITGLGSYSASVSVSKVALGSGANQISNAGDVLRIAITVSRPGADSITLEGYRARYAPNTLP
jgi:MSHA pilin protein MshD